MATYLEHFYSVFPAWLNAVGLLAAAAGFVARAWLHAKRRDYPVLPYASVGVVGALCGFALCYGWIETHPASSIALRGGVVRICVFLLSLALVNFNWTVISMAFGLVLRKSGYRE